VSLAHYEAARRSSTSAPTPEARSVRVATKVTGPTSGGPPVLGNAVAVAVGLAVAVAVGVAVAVAVGLAVAVAVAVGLAVMAPPRCCFAKAAEASSRTSTALTATTSKTFFIKHPLYLSQMPSL
jgi:hypothetical protein